MAFSVLDGLPMGTRCGCLDPGVILYLLRQGMDVDQLERLLYQKSGLLGISGISNDVRALLANDSRSAADAIDYFVYRIAREVGSLTSALGGLDALVFTAGIGENSPVIRARVCEMLSWLGIALISEANERGQGQVSPPGRTPSVWVIPTDEESVIAQATAQVVGITR
jgi:acetate kinase